MAEEEEDLEGTAEGNEEQVSVKVRRGGEGEDNSCSCVQVYDDLPLTKELAGEGLSLLCKTGNGLAHAYVRMDLRDK